MKILIVDDIKENLYLLEVLLKGSGYEVVSAGNGAEAIEKLRTESIDIIISDVLMPIMDGFKLCKEVKGKDELKNIPFIFYTATYKDERDEKLASMLGADRYVRKPIEPDEFIKIIQGMIRDVEKGKVKPKKPSLEEEEEVLKLYSERLINKLEKKMLDLEKEITERKRAEKELKRLYTQLKESQSQLIQSEKMSAVGTFVAGVAHELNNPITAILHFVQYCIKHTSEEDRLYTILQDIEKETRSCIDTTQNLLTFSHIQRKEVYQKESLNTILSRVMKLLSYRIENDNISIGKHIAIGVPDIPMNVNNIQQVFLNLLNNALDALKESKQKKIDIDILCEGKYVKVTIADSGCGIAPENISNVFDPFFTTKPVGQGTGLGLSLCQGIINAHNGKLTCESKPGVGTRFKILLPIRKERKK